MKPLFILLALCLASVAFAQMPCSPNSSSLSFNGFSDYVDLSNASALAIDSNLTVEAWIKPAAFAGTPAQGSIFCKHGWSQGEGGYVLRAGGNGQVSFNIAGLDVNGIPTSWEEVISPVNSISTGVWSHVAGVYGNDTLKLYINGLLIAQTAYAGSIVGSSFYSPKIGRLADTFGGRYWNGLLDEIRIWKRALTGAEIAQHMNMHINPASNGLVAYWRMNEGSGSQISDLSASGIIGSLLAPSFNTDIPFTVNAPVATISIAPSDTVCQGAQASFTAFPQGVNAYTYSWSNGSSGWLMTSSVAGNYYVVVTDSVGCSDTSETVSLVTQSLPPAAVLSYASGNITAANVQGAYQWYLNGTPFNDDLVVNNAANGSYQIMVTDTITGCVSMSDTVLLNTSIGQYGAAFSIGPNPAGELIQLNLIKPIGRGTWQLYDASGRIIRSGTIGSAETMVSVNLHGLVDGVYFMAVFADDVLSVQRFIKSSR